MKGAAPATRAPRPPAGSGKQGPKGSRKPGARKPAAPRPAGTAARTAGASRRPKRRTLVVLTGAVLALVVAVVVAVTALGGGDGDEVATLDGRPVTREELLFHMGRLAPTVQNELTTTYHLATPFGWDAKTGAKTALQRLETRALDEIREDRAVLVLAQERGLVDSVDFADLTAERTAENESRAQAVAAGQTVYGVTDFSPEEYYTHRLTELATSLKDLLSKNAGDPLHVTDAEVRKAFDADPGSWSANATTYAYTQLVVQVPDGAPAGFAADLQRRVKAAGHLADVTGVTGAKLTTATYGGTGTTGLSTHDQDLVSVLGELDRGQVSAPVKGTGQITYYQLDSVKTDQDKAFTEYSQRIRQSLVEKKYATYLQRRADDASMYVDSSAVAAINAKDVQQ
ncbi:peptidylprolyl isomerase [Streptomyces sp. NBC_00102]|uniref:peptidylprolyl isomerase n=1 Tax=Streptomyces sp. NBC_00102 TaxID=2975652 RepID=UPI00224DEEE7|nr:peptidylprolyl isomerase [Streptomyces sp. NBC_00102]MCX5395793.1 peptidyl-prolyl cis-trans isomerase [Streptomyces sp. NBC_00102]